MDLKEMGLTSKQRMQLADEQMWLNPNDEWLDYDSNEEESDEEEKDVADWLKGKEPKEKEQKIETPKAKTISENGEEIDDDELDGEEIQDLGDDPLYNEKGDDDDEKWVAKNLAKFMPKGRQTDAVLNCPCCFALLCLDCQRHDTYINQYRAMFVRNCKTLPKEIKYKRQHDTENEERPYEFIDRIMVEDEGMYFDEIYHPVVCAVCETELAILDDEEVYHFFNVIPSEG